MTITPVIGPGGKKFCFVETTHDGVRQMDAFELRAAARVLRWRCGEYDQSVACLFELSAHGLDGGFLPCV